MMVGRLEGRYLEMLTFALGARSVLEIGTFGGYSALSMAAGLAPGGRITTCEISPVHAEFARRHIAASPYADRIEVVVGPAIDTIATLDGPVRPGLHRRRQGGLPRLLRGGAAQAGPPGPDRRRQHPVERPDPRPSDTSEDTVALRRFNDALAVDPRVVVVQTTVRDGVTLIRRAG